MSVSMAGRMAHGENTGLKCLPLVAKSFKRSLLSSKLSVIRQYKRENNRSDYNKNKRIALPYREV